MAPTETVTIEMLETTKGCDNDLHKYHPESYIKGEIYEVGPDLAKNFVEDQKVAKKTKKKVTAVKPEAKEDEADDNKENKGDEDK